MLTICLHQAQEMVEKADIMQAVLEARKEVKKKWKGAKRQRQKVLDHAVKVAEKVERRVRRKCARVMAARIAALENGEEDPGAAVRFPALSAPTRPINVKGSSNRKLRGGAGQLPRLKN